MEPIEERGSGGPVAGEAGGDTEIASGRAPHQPASVGFLLSQLGYAAAAGFRDALAPLGLDPPHFATLRALGANEGQSQQAVCTALHIPPSRMVHLVDDLENGGLVERRPNAVDRRARAVHLTDQGRELLGRALATAVDYEGRVSASLDAGEREQLLAMLTRLAGHFGLLRDVHPHLTGPRLPGWPVDQGAGEGGPSS